MQTTKDPSEDPVQVARDLTVEVARLHRAFDRRTRVITAVSVAVLSVAVALVIAVILVTRTAAENSRRIDESNLRWCPLVLLLVPGHGGPPTTTARGQQIADEAAALARSFHCPTPEKESR